MRIGIIGGGAAGFFGGINAATHNRTAEVVLLEATRQPLDKVRISGGGRCNVAHSCFEPSVLAANYPRGFKELLGLFHRFQPLDTITWFEKNGVKLKTEEDGRMFPVTDQSATIVNCLIDRASESGVKIRLGIRVKSVTVKANGSSRFDFVLHDGTAEQYDRILIATGNSPQGYRIAADLGHTIVPCVPSLFTFKVADKRLKELAGISFEEVELTLTCGGSRKLTQRGPMLITHWGVSGPAVLKLSAWGAKMLHECNYHADLTVNFLPGANQEAVLEQLQSHKQRRGKQKVLASSPWLIPKRYWSRIAALSGIEESTTWMNLSKKEMKALLAELTRARFLVSGKGIFKEEFVTCGGVSLKEVDFRTMQSKVCPGLYFAGEILDIDGITGGFNFQSAWSTAWVAGNSMAGV